MERYNEYKDSSVQWLGEIPSHWECEKAKRHFQSRKQIVGRNSSQYERLALTLKGVIKRFEGDGVGLNPEKLDTYQIVDKDDLIFKLIDLENVSTSRVGLSPYKGIVSPAYIRISAVDEVNIRFAEYYYLNMWMRHIFNDLGTPGVRSNLSSTDLLNLPLLYPSIVEQKAIATYLDKATAKIDEAIAQQQKMIDLLNERKQIIINNAVTKGLNHDAPMKDSGVDYIGLIPENWEVTKLKSIGTTINGVSHDSSYFGEGYPFVSYSDVYKNSILPLTVNGLAKSTTLEQKIFSVKEGDVFFTRTSETAEEIGTTSTCIKTIPQAVFAGFLIRFRPRKGILDSKFSSFYFRAQIHRSYFVKEMNLVIRASLSQQLLKGLPVLLPHIQEQREIADYLIAETGKIEQAINTYTKQIYLLQERKQIIINDVVTGKVKVS